MCVCVYICALFKSQRPGRWNPQIIQETFCLTQALVPMDNVKQNFNLFVVQIIIIIFSVDKIS